MIGLLTLVANSGSAWFGFMIFFVLSLGLGLPLYRAGDLFRSTRSLAAIRRVDALGAPRDGLDSGSVSI